MIKKFVIVAGVLLALSGFAVAKTADHQVHHLTLDDALKIALKNNLDIEISSFQVRASQMKVQIYDGGFDPLLSASAGYRDDRTQKASTVFGTQTTDYDYTVGVHQRFKSGTRVGVGFQHNRDSSNSIFATSPVTNDSRVELTLSQDIGRNFFGHQDRGRQREAELMAEDDVMRDADLVEAIITEVRSVYWDLVWQQERVEIQRQMVQQAKDLLDLHEEKIQDGLIEEPDLLASQANYEDRRNFLRILENDVVIKSNALKELLNIDPMDSVVLKDVQPMSEDDFNLAESLRQAFEFRKDYRRVRNNLELRNIQVSLAGNDLWPEVDLTASFTRNGLGDDVSDSFREIFEEDHVDFFLGITFEYPLGNRGAEGELTAAQMRQAAALLGIKQLENRIKRDVIDAVQSCRTYYAYAVNSKEVSDLQEQKLVAERKRFDSGRSSTDQIIRYQEDVLRSREIAAEAKFRYRLALIDLKRTLGTVLLSRTDTAVKH